MADLVPGRDQLLEDAEVERYSRQLLLPEVAESGQLRLRAARAVVVGCGGLGGPAALYLAGAGVGGLRLVDPDQVELDNLHRQVFFRSADVGRSKAELLAESLGQLNPLVVAQAVPSRVGEGTLEGILADADLVLECSDDPETKFLVNDWCVARQVPLVVGAAIGFSGQLVVVSPRAACYRCLFPGPPAGAAASCRAAGVIGPLVGVVAALQALEGIKMLLGLGGGGAAGRLISFEGLDSRWRELRFPMAAGCQLHPS